MNKATIFLVRLSNQENPYARINYLDAHMKLGDIVENVDDPRAVRIYDGHSLVRIGNTCLSCKYSLPTSTWELPMNVDNTLHPDYASNFTWDNYNSCTLHK